MSNISTVKIAGSSFLLPDNAAWSNSDAGLGWEFSGYNSWVAALDAIKADETIVIVLFDEDLSDDIATLGQKASSTSPFASAFQIIDAKAKSVPDAKFIVAHYSEIGCDFVSASTASNAWINAYQLTCGSAAQLKGRNNNVYVLDLNAVFSRSGTANCISERNYYLARARLSVLGVRTLCSALTKIITRFMFSPKKVLVLDCDNTIWGGVIGEDGVSNIALGLDGIGKAFQDFQKEALRLAHRGVLVCLVSKNNEDDVLDVFENHEEMVLSLDNIVDYRIDWQPKHINVRELSESLALGLDSFVFWDDLEKERAEMRYLLPDVTTIEPPKNVHMWPSALRSLPEFCSLSTTSDDRQRSRLYRARQEFTDGVSASGNDQDFLKSIGMQVTVTPVNEGNIARAVQLCEKTNQFNLRTKRHTINDIISLGQRDNSLQLLFRLKDAFGDHGVTALAQANPIGGGRVCFLNTFLLSCRVLGRHFESWCLGTVLARMKAAGAEVCLAEYVETSKNTAISKFLFDHGFVPYAYDDEVINAYVDGQALRGSLWIYSLDIPYKCNAEELFDEDAG